MMLPIDVWRNQQKPPSEVGIRSTIQSYIQTIIKLSSLFSLSENSAIDPTNPLAPNPILGQRHQELLFQRLAVKQPTSSDSGVIVVLKDIPKNHFKLPIPINTEVSECSQPLIPSPSKVLPQKTTTQPDNPTSLVLCSKDFQQLLEPCSVAHCLSNR